MALSEGFYVNYTQAGLPRDSRSKIGSVYFGGHAAKILLWQVVCETGITKDFVLDSEAVL